jgi:septal ring factor EnvC (AmiA/AmiB activator)
MELKIIVLVVCLGAILCTASCHGGNHFNPSLYASEISQLISDVNKDIEVSRKTLRQLQEAVTRYGDAFKETSDKVKQFETALKKITSSVGGTGGGDNAFEKLVSLLEKK